MTTYHPSVETGKKPKLKNPNPYNWEKSEECVQKVKIKINMNHNRTLYLSLLLKNLYES